MKLHAALLLSLCATASAQFEILDAHTTASLRGIDAVSPQIAWASGSNGTVLLTTDGGTTWKHCAIPPNGEKFDFRGVQAFDATTALVMASGKGPLSAVFRTKDACATWKLIFADPDADGFFDAIRAPQPDSFLVLADSVKGQLRVWDWSESVDGSGGEAELSYQMKGPAIEGEGSFAASNTVLQQVRTAQIDKKWKFAYRWTSQVAGHSFMHLVRDEQTSTCEPCVEEQIRVEMPLAGEKDSAGAFSFDFRDDLKGVAVGGEYTKPELTARTAAFTADGGLTWTLAATSPHGYRSAVVFDPHARLWIAVGPNGTDISRDDGKNWTPLKPAHGDTPDADQHWNAISLPFVVGSKGRIGKLHPEAPGK